jgi:hypothetical protein
MHMTLAALAYFGEKPEAFPHEIDRTRKNADRFMNRVFLAMTDSLKDYIDSDMGFSDSQKKKQAKEWSKTVNNLNEINRLLRQLQTAHRQTLSYRLKRIELADLDVARSTLKRALMEARIEMRSLEQRGNKRDRMSVLTTALFENLEWRLGRHLARSFALHRPKSATERSSSRSFVNADAELIRHIVIAVVPSAAVITIRSALKSMPSRKSGD